MIGLDTNVLVRYIMQDDAKQAAKATALIERLSADEPGFISIVSMVELVWVLSSGYGLGREDVARALDVLLGTRQFVVDQSERVGVALQACRASRADFADCLIQLLCAGAGCGRTMTFDKGAAKFAGMALIA